MSSVLDRSVSALIIAPIDSESTVSKDAECFLSALLDAYPWAHVHELRSDASIPAIGRELYWLRSSKADFSLVYFTGHGTRTDIDSFLVTVDSEAGNEGFPLSMLVRQMPKHGTESSWLAILDCCHPDTSGLHNGIARSDVDAALNYYGTNRAILAACEPGKEAVAIKDRNSPFTREVIYALGGAASNSRGEVTIGSLYDFISTRLSGERLPPPVLAGDLASAFTLREGLPARGNPAVTGESLERLIEDAQRFASSLHGASAVSDARWRQSGWMEATRQIEPVLRWFGRIIREHPEVTSNPAFAQAYHTVQRLFAGVTNVGPGIWTEVGVVGERLGEGGFGSVWTVSRPTGPVRALKVYHANQLFNAEKLGRFERGYRAMRRLSHPQIVSVHDYSVVPPAIHMDCINGIDLERAVLPESLEARREIVLSVGNTLSYAHSKGVVHRDIKPANIILIADVEKWTPVITDFDLAWYPTATEVTRTGLGAPFYAAPEQSNDLDSTRGRDVRVDVFAMGQILYYLLTDQNPHHGSIDQNVSYLERTMRQKYDCSNGTIARFVDIYLCATSVKQEDRFASMNLLCRAIEDLDIQARSSGMTEEVVPSSVELGWRPVIQAAFMS